MSNVTLQVEGFIRKNKPWQEELKALRKIVLDCELVEDIKWRTPCYTYEGVNLVMIGAFKSGAVLSFLKGALLKDREKLLIAPGQNTQSARMIRFVNAAEIAEKEAILKAYIREVIEAEKAGLKVKFKSTGEFSVPEELQKKFDETPAFKAAFDALTPGRQRGYLLYFSAAKQSKTREARIEKYEKKILGGKGVDD